MHEPILRKIANVIFLTRFAFGEAGKAKISQNQIKVGFVQEIRKRNDFSSHKIHDFVPALLIIIFRLQKLTVNLNLFQV